MMVVVSSGSFACYALSAWSIRLLPNNRVIYRAIPLILLIPAVFFIFGTIKFAISQYIDFGIAVTSALLITIDGYMKLHDKGKGL